MRHRVWWLLFLAMFSGFGAGLLVERALLAKKSRVESNVEGEFVQAYEMRIGNPADLAASAIEEHTVRGLRDRVCRVWQQTQVLRRVRKEVSMNGFFVRIKGQPGQVRDVFDDAELISVVLFPVVAGKFTLRKEPCRLMRVEEGWELFETEYALRKAVREAYEAQVVREERTREENREWQARFDEQTRLRKQQERSKWWWYRLIEWLRRDQ